MDFRPTRRELLRLAAAAGGAVLASELPGFREAFAAEDRSFWFVQLSDTHWGFRGPAVNPEPEKVLPRAVAAVNALSSPPAFVVFTGDLTHGTDDEAERRSRLSEFRRIAAGLKAADVRFLAGEHDAAQDGGEAFRAIIGPTRYSFDHDGVHFIALDNASDPRARLGEEQLEWLRADLGARDRDAPIVVLTHRPLFDLAPAWDWATPDAARALTILGAWRHVVVFYGHIHQEHHHQTGGVTHHAARSLMFPLPPPPADPAARKAPVPWDPAHPGHGLGFREVEEKDPAPAIVEHPVEGL